MTGRTGARRQGATSNAGDSASSAGSRVIRDGAAPDGGELAERIALGAEITRQRQAALMSHTAVADGAGVSVALIRRLEQGTTGPIELALLRAIAGALGTTPGALLDAATATNTSTVFSSPDRGRFVLLPTRVAGTEQSATAWRLLEYLPRPLGRRWELPTATEPDRSVSRPILAWASGLLGSHTTVLGSAIELTGQRSWYLGPDHHPPARRES